MSLQKRLAEAAITFWVTGGRLRCPNCTEGRLFERGMVLHETCQLCGVRYERMDGESIGGVAITMLVVPSVAVGGFVMTDIMTATPAWVNGGVWLVVLVIGCAVTYRRARGLWIGFSYLTGGVYADPPLPAPPDTSEARQQLIDAMNATRPK